MSEHLLVRKRKCCCLLNLQAPKAGSALLGNDAMLKLVREFQNAVERNQWRSVAFTADSEHLAAAAHSKTEHIIYIWNREFGNLTRILEGSHQTGSSVLNLPDIHPHPLPRVLLCHPLDLSQNSHEGCGDRVTLSAAVDVGRPWQGLLIFMLWRQDAITAGSGMVTGASALSGLTTQSEARKHLAAICHITIQPQ